MASAHIYHGSRARAIRYTGGHTAAPPRRPSIMSKVAATTKALFTGQQTSSGTYILPHSGGYTFGRWYRSRVAGFDGSGGEHVRWVQLGERPTVEACREAMEHLEKAQEQRAKLLNRKRMRGA